MRTGTGLYETETKLDDVGCMDPVMCDCDSVWLMLVVVCVCKLDEEYACGCGYVC